MAKPNPLVRSWKYMSAWFGAKVDERADPKIQIEQAIQEAQRQHQALTQQAAAVIGNQRQLEMQLDRQLNTIEKLNAQARQALMLADNARAAGDEAKAAQFEETAQALANQLVSAESAVEDLKRLHDQALQAAGRAREAVQTNSQMLQQRLAERSKLLTQLEQAKMQETVSASLQQMSDLAAPSNVPTLDESATRSRSVTPPPSGRRSLRVIRPARGSSRWSARRLTCRAPPGWTRSVPRWPPSRSRPYRRRRRMPRSRTLRRRARLPSTRRRRSSPTKPEPQLETFGWQVGHQYVLRVRGGRPCSARSMGVRQRRQGCPARS
jgi:phage shock protein A